MKERIVRTTQTFLGYTASDLMGMVRSANPLLTDIRVEYSWPSHELEPDNGEVVLEISYKTTEVVRDE